MHNFKELKIWQKAMTIAEKTYDTSVLLPSDERFGLISQMRRSAISIPSNIAKGLAESQTASLNNF